MAARRASLVRRVIGVGAVILWVIALHAQVTVWQDETALWSQAVRAAPAMPRPWANLARSLALDGRIAEARVTYQRALWLALTRPEGERRVTGLVVRANLERLRQQEDTDIFAWIRTP